MKLSVLKLFWFLLCLTLSLLIGADAYRNPTAFYSVLDLFIPVIAIFFGALLAIVALLSSSIKIGDTHYSNNEEKIRIEGVIKRSGDNLIFEQTILFVIYYAAIIVSFAFKLYYISINIIDMTKFEVVFLACLSSAFGFLSSFSLLWSCMLPFLLRSLAKQRSDLA